MTHCTTCGNRVEKDDPCVVRYGAHVVECCYCANLDDTFVDDVYADDMADYDRHADAADES